MIEVELHEVVKLHGRVVHVARCVDCGLHSPEFPLPASAAKWRAGHMGLDGKPTAVICMELT